MSTSRTTAPGGLSTSEIDGIRESLAAGRKPKVMFTEAAGQVAGEIGQVVKLGDPAESDEWLVVRFGRDELPFAPTDLTLPPRGRPAKRTDPKPPADPPAPPLTAPSPAAGPAKAPGATAPGTNPPGTNPPGTNPPGTSPAGAAATSSGTTPDQEAAAPAKKAARKARPAKPKPPASLIVTLSYESGEWLVGAQQGSKTLAKPYVVRAADALKMVALLDVPGVQEAVEAIVAAEVNEAAQRAEQLRNELAEVEARLADLRDAG